ncbi:MAG: bifunctional methylenetetrahydrofolate dehydrogenase/methenyltetrahydrofolate cyclohydrolase FolD [Planctomycetota bacterium]
MSAQILDGAALAASLRADIKQQVAERTAAGLRPPGLAVLLVGDDPASEIYVRHKRNDCLAVGFKSELRHLAQDTSEAQVADMILTLNEDPTIDGILVQAPLPPQIDANVLVELILPAKDVDGFHPYNVGRLALRDPSLRPATPKGVMQLLELTGPIRGQDALVVGASNHVGRPMSLELLLAGCTTNIAHRFTKDLREHVERADILVSAVGKPNLIPGAWIKPGSVVIDIGITREGGRLQGDVHFDTAVERAGWITPVPGGVGPMTRIGVLQNTLQAAEASEARTS